MACAANVPRFRLALHPRCGVPARVIPSPLIQTAEAVSNTPFPSCVFDVAIIGAGVVGPSIARVLGHLECPAAVVEKEYDVGMGASARNSRVIHTGLNYRPGSLRARFCMEGRELLQKWCDELNVPVSIRRKLIVARSAPATHMKRYERPGRVAARFFS